MLTATATDEARLRLLDERERILGGRHPGELQGKPQRQLLRIDEAIHRLDSGTWGRCEICGSRIDAMRLDARPEAELCSDCSTV